MGNLNNILNIFFQHFFSETGFKVVSKWVATTLAKAFYHKIGLKCIRWVDNADAIPGVPQISSFNLIILSLSF